MNNFTQNVFTSSRKFLNGINPTFILLVSLLFTSFSYGQVSVTTTTPITQNFDGLSSTAPATWTNNTSPLAGWYSTVTTLNPNNGSTNSNNVYNCGTTSATDRALGALSTTTTHNFGIRLKNNNANAISSILVSYNGEQWRQNAANQTLVFEYQIGTTVTSITAGTWTAVTALDFVSPNIGTAAALDGNLTANRTAKSSMISLSIPAGSEIMLRWTKSGTNSHILAIDDLSITPTFAISTPTISVAATATAFTTTYGTASAVQSFTVTGSNLTAGITATAPTGFEVSSDGTTYGTTASFGTTGGTLRIRLAATAAVGGSYNSQSISLVSTGATTININTTATGNTVTAKNLTITGLTTSNKVYDGTTSVSVTGTLEFLEKSGQIFIHPKLPFLNC